MERKVKEPGGATRWQSRVERDPGRSSSVVNHVSFYGEKTEINTSEFGDENS